MPTMEDLGKLATELYGVQVGAKQEIHSGLTLDRTKASSMGFTGFFYVWSGEEASHVYASGRGFDSSRTYWNYDGRSYSIGRAVCLGE